MSRTYQPILFLAALTFLLMFSIQVQAQDASGRPHSSTHTNGTFTRPSPTSTRHRNGTTSATPTITDSGGFATGTNVLNAGENMTPQLAIGGLGAVALGWLLAF
ncbi:hypothetical protein DSL72_003934 [Monilinia vaccinii-corymbosi]|uniref:Uncharacterized protein n=1 Tax=Monilinia vaccinii-corymbosi TaxID=61207 RepID=A0A8A3NZ76_9HELO|nr:hypothetical protein DSL72_003934 [Monilinia vaccinii-corymbosi]